MLNSVVDAFHSFASSVELADGLRIARREFVTLRGDLFDSDSDYEARLGVFLDWFLCDRKVRIGDTTKSAASYFIDERASKPQQRGACLRGGISRLIIATAAF